MNNNLSSILVFKVCEVSIYTQTKESWQGVRPAGMYGWHRYGGGTSQVRDMFYVIYRGGEKRRGWITNTI